MNQYKKIGIIGGMGPEATADLYLKIVRYFQGNFGAQYDRDYPEFLISSIPIPDVVNRLEDEALLQSMLCRAASMLERNGSQCIAIACNTVQYLLREIQGSVTIPVLGIAQSNAAYCKAYGYTVVGILATATTMQRQVYDDAMRRSGITLVRPTASDQAIVTQTIMAQLSGGVPEELLSQMKMVVDRLQRQGANAALLACTDLPLAISAATSPIPIVDCTQVYAVDLASFAIGRKPQPAQLPVLPRALG